MAALSSFDQCCEEDERMNRMKECVVLFNSIANHKLFADTAFILFMNKIDVFQRKLDAGSLVKTHFSEYDGPNDYATASAFLHSRFLQQCKDTAKQIYTHFTHATVSWSLILSVLGMRDCDCIGGCVIVVAVDDDNDVAEQNTLFFVSSFVVLNCAMWWHNRTLYTWLVIPYHTMSIFFSFLFLISLCHCLSLMRIFFWGSATCLIFFFFNFVIMLDTWANSVELIQTSYSESKLTILIFSSAFFFASQSLRSR